MKTTLDLPSDLVREMKMRAAQEGRKLRDVATEIFRRGLSAQALAPSTSRSRVQLPLIQCASPVPPSKELNPDELSEVLLKQEVKWSR